MVPMAIVLKEFFNLLREVAFENQDREVQESASDAESGGPMVVRSENN